MATTEENQITEAAHIRHNRPYNSATKNLDDATIDALIDQGSLQASSVNEHALAQTGHYNVVSKTGYDFDDALKSDAKISTVRWRKKKTIYSAPVTSFAAKIGALRVQVWERFNDKFFYFIIPVHVHKKFSNIEIPFNRDGTPNRQSSFRGVNWWDYEVKTFTELACNMIDPVSARELANIQRLESMFPIKKHTGGRVKGQLSMTPDAVRKRAARARQREASAART